MNTLVWCMDAWRIIIMIIYIYIYIYIEYYRGNYS